MGRSWPETQLVCLTFIHAWGSKFYVCVLTHVSVCAVCVCLRVYRADFLSIRTPSLMGSVRQAGQETATQKKKFP